MKRLILGTIKRPFPFSKSQLFAKKRGISLIMVFLFCINMGSSVFATDIPSSNSIEYVTDENGNIINSSYTIELVDELMQERVRALAQNDSEKVSEITQQLANMGGRPSTYHEIEETVGARMAMQTYGDGDSVGDLDGYIYFETYYSNVTIDGTTYRVRRVYATPGTNTVLHHHDILTAQVDCGLPSGVAAAIKTAGRAYITGASYEIGLVSTFYDVLSQFIGSLTGTTIISDIDVSYECALLEHCVFLSFESGNDNWVDFAISSYAAGTVDASYDYLDYSVTPPALRIASEQYYVEQFVDSSHYNIADYLLTSFFTTGELDTSTQIDRFAIYSGGDANDDEDNGTYVGSISMFVPRGLWEIE